MLLPTHCPDCKETLLEEKIDLSSGTVPILIIRLDRFCPNPNHKKLVYCSSTKDHNICNIISYDLKPGVRALWYLYDKEPIFLFNTWNYQGSKDYILNWFPPNFQNFNVMNNKLNTYLTFL